MKWKPVSITFILALSVFSLTITIVPDNARATIRYVGGFGPGNYTTIQSAIDAANVGDTVFVYNGTYVESVRVSKSLRLFGEHMNTTVIDGAGTSFGVLIEADSVTMSGFSITNASDHGVELYISSGSEISNNNISGNLGSGIFVLYSPFTIITRNIIFDNDRDAIYTFDSQGCTISKNNVSGNDPGVGVYDSNSSIIDDNIISNSTFWGITVLNSHNSRVTNNYLFDNDEGIYLLASESVSAQDNYISGSKVGILLHYLNWSSAHRNTMSGGGIHLYGDSGWHWNSLTIPTSNSVDGRPIHYWKNTVGGTVPPDAGQVILGNCRGVTVENQNISNVYSGIQVGYGSGNAIINEFVWTLPVETMWLAITFRPTLITAYSSDLQATIRLETTQYRSTENMEHSSVRPPATTRYTTTTS
jgi:parallel beta-helix repeat protein